MQENNFCCVYEIHAKNTFVETSNIYIYKKEFKTCQGIGGMQHTRKLLNFFLSKHIASQLNVNTKMENSKPSFILQELQETKKNS